MEQYPAKEQINSHIPSDAKIICENEEGTTVLRSPIWEKLRNHFNSYPDMLGGTSGPSGRSDL